MQITCICDKQLSISVLEKNPSQRKMIAFGVQKNIDTKFKRKLEENAKSLANVGLLVQ